MSFDSRIIRRLLVMVVPGVLTMLLAGCNTEGLLVQLEDGAVQGDQVGGSRLFLAIPYAEPPVGDLRWKAPQRNQPWTGVRHTTEFASPCAQRRDAGAPPSNEEDCLYLNVWAPNVNVKNAPVMVWIHGGGNFSGSASVSVPTSLNQLWYNGRYFAGNQDTVVVTLNYRLGPMGFFALEALADEQSPAGNQGLLDQRMALQWVKNNIEKFGGDPANVTIFGESAGAADVCYHLVSPGSQGLFQRAISQSGGCTARSIPTREAAQSGMNKFVAAMGCENTDDVLACLRSKTTEEIMANAEQPKPTAGGIGTDSKWKFEPVIDGTGGVLPELPSVLIQRPELIKVPYLIGSNSEEGNTFLIFAKIPRDDASYEAELTRRYGDFAPELAAMYPVEKFNGSYRRALSRAVGDALTCGVRDTAKRAQAAGFPVYMYSFNIRWSIAFGILGRGHAAEISHVFGKPYWPTPGTQKQADIINRYWATFARNGDPNYVDAPAIWPAYFPDERGDDQLLQLDSRWVVLDNFRKAECDLWETYFAGQWQPVSDLAQR